MNPKYLISTMMGDLTVELEGPVYVQMDNRHFLRKMPYDLNVGDMLAFPKAYARAQLEDVEHLLFGSPRYSYAWDIVFDTNSKGEKIPKLRIYLIRGLMNHGFFGDDFDCNEIERKIMREGADFTTNEIKSMEDYVRKILVQFDQIDIGDDTPYSWLRGFTAAPYGFDRNGANILSALGELLSPEFGQWRYQDASPKSVYYNYMLQRVIRNKIMWYLNECRGTHTGKAKTDEEIERGEGITVGPEYELIFRRFFRDISPDLASARITKIQTLESRKQIDAAEDKSFKLEDGIVSEQLEFLENSLIDPLYVFMQKELLEGYFESIIEDLSTYDLKSSQMFKLAESRDRMARYMHATDLTCYLVSHFNKSLDTKDEEAIKKDYGNHSLYRGTESKFGKWYEKHTSDMGGILKSVLEGDIDEFFNYDRGTTMKLVEAITMSSNAIPKFFNTYFGYVEDYKWFRKQNPSGPPKIMKEGRNLKKKADEARKKIRNEYGIHFRGWGSDSTYCPQRCPKLQTSINSFFSYIMEKGFRQTPREYFEKNDVKKEDIEPFISSLPDDIRIIRKNQVEQILKDNGLEQILDHRWQDFVWEDLEIDAPGQSI